MIANVAILLLEIWIITFFTFSDNSGDNFDTFTADLDDHWSCFSPFLRRKFSGLDDGDREKICVAIPKQSVKKITSMKWSNSKQSVMNGSQKWLNVTRRIDIFLQDFERFVFLNLHSISTTTSPEPNAPENHCDHPCKWSFQVDAFDFDIYFPFNKSPEPFLFEKLYLLQVSLSQMTKVR